MNTTAEKSIDWISQEMARLAHEIERAQHAADGAMDTARGAKTDISAHEKLCALRYENINMQLSAVPKIFEKLDEVRRMLYIGIGAWLATLGVGAIIGMVVAVIKLAHGG